MHIYIKNNSAEIVRDNTTQLGECQLDIHGRSGGSFYVTEKIIGASSRITQVLLLHFQNYLSSHLTKKYHLKQQLSANWIFTVSFIIGWPLTECKKFTVYNTRNLLSSRTSHVFNLFHYREKTKPNYFVGFFIFSN